MPGPLILAGVLSTTLLAFNVLRKWIAQLALWPKHVPGPPTPNLILGHTMLFDSPVGIGKHLLWNSQLGPTYCLRGPFLIPRLVLGDPKGLNHVLTNGKNYQRNQGDRAALELFFGHSLFSEEGETHKRMRKYLSGPFTVQAVQEVSHVFYDLAYRVVEQWQRNIVDGQSTFDIGPDMHMATLDAISMTMFMYDMSSSQAAIPQTLHKITNSPSGDLQTVLLETIAGLFPALLKLPSPMRTWCDHLRTELGKIAKEVWDGKESAGMHASLLESLTANQVGKEEAVGQIIGILFAGSETSANVVTECLYELARNSRIQQRLRDEITTFEAAKGRFPTIEDLMSASALPYLDAVTRETMRTRAVLREISREAIKDDIIPLEFPIPGTDVRELHVKAGLVIEIPVRDGVNVDERIWGPDASRFVPERWIEPGGLPESVKMMRAQGHLLTFGDGPKVCLGRNFALAEFKVFLCIIIRHLSFTVDPSIVLDFYHLSGNTVKPKIRNRESEGVQLPLTAECTT